VDGVAREDNGAGLRQPDQQRLMTRRVAGVEMITTDTSPNTSRSPSSKVTG
jgi:hypothetical protein